MRVRLHAVAGLAVLISYLAVSFSHFLTSRVGHLDESIQLMGAFLISRGFVPHIDFWSMYTPLNYYLTAFAFWWMGTSAISARILQECLFSVFLIVIFFGLKTICRRRSLFIFNLTVIASILAGNIFTYAWWNAYAIGFSSLVLYALYLQKTQIIFLVACGLMAGLACLGKLNFGMYVVSAIFVSLILDPGGFRVKQIFAFVLPVILCFAAYLIPYGSFARQVIQQILIFPSQGLEQHRIVSLPQGWNGYGTLLAAVFPLIWIGFRSLLSNLRFNRSAVIAFSTAALYLVILFLVGRQYQELLPKFFLLPALTLITLQIAFRVAENFEFALLIAYVFFNNYFLSRIDPVHYSVLLPFLILLGGYTLRQRHFSSSFAQVGAGLLVVALCASPAYWNLRHILTAPQGTLKHTREILRLRTMLRDDSDSDVLMKQQDSPLAYLYPIKTELQVAKFVAQHTKQSDPVYIGLKDHSRVYMSPMRLTWIAGRNIGVRNFLLEPGLTTEEWVQQEMIQDLKMKKVVWMILRDNRKGDEDFERRNYRGANILDHYIAENYEPVQEFGIFTIYKLKSLQLDRNSPYL